MLRLHAPPGNQMEPHNEDNVITIHYTHKGPKPKGASNNAWKRYAWEVHGVPYIYNLLEGSPLASIILTSNDESSSPHKDPLVITHKVGSRNVSRTLVDTKSSINLIFLTTMYTLGVKDGDIYYQERDAFSRIKK